MAMFKLFSVGVLSAAVITKVQANGTKDGCVFSLSASGGIECPACQLDDGQIRLNGSYATAEFTIRGDRIGTRPGADASSLVQCDLNKEPAPGFSIDRSNKLLYQGSSEFYACAAMDTEYIVCIKPDFGQTKCFAVTLTASGCGSAPPPPAPPTSAPTCPSTQPASTVTETTTCTVTRAVTVSGNASTVSVTGPVSIVSISGVGSTTTETATCTVTDTSTITSMGTVTSTLLCTSSSSSSTSKSCHKCRSHNSTATSSWTTSTTSCHNCMGTGTGGPHPTGLNSATTSSLL